MQIAEGTELQQAAQQKGIASENKNS